MKKYFPHILILVVLVGIFSPIVKVQAQVCWRLGATRALSTQTQEFCESSAIQGTWQAVGSPVPPPPNGPSSTGAAPASEGEDASSGCSLNNLTQCFLNTILLIPGYAAIGILKLATLLTYLSGAILNFVIKFTVVNMKTNIEQAGAVNNAWQVIRDIANMGFIFVLLYAAIKTILGLGSDTQKLIRNIVIVAILINFSLFFTKVVIDISNVLAVFFYDAIAPGSLSATATKGLSDSLMQPLGLQSIFNTTSSGLAGGRLFTIGVMGTILALIAAFVFFAVAIMFIIRFVVLIFVLILSPIAFVAHVFPGLDGPAKQWQEALIGQSFFAPIYLMLTWIVIVASRGLLTGGSDLASALSGTIGPNGQVVAPTNLGILVNFIIMIALLISSLLIAKNWANRAGPAASGLTKWAMGAAGGATIGMAGRFSRGTIGRAGQAVADSQWLKDRAPNSRLARLALATGKKTGAASFDARGTPLSATLGAGKAGGKGGYQAAREEKINKRMQFAEKDLTDIVTGADVETEMERRGYGKVANEGRVTALIATGRSRRDATMQVAQEVERERRRYQALLIAGATQNTAQRRERYLHNLSQTHWYTPNLYSGVSEDAEAARRLREPGRKSKKGGKDKILADLAEVLKEEETTPPTPPTPVPPTPTP